MKPQKRRPEYDLCEHKDLYNKGLLPEPKESIYSNMSTLDLISAAFEKVEAGDPLEALVTALTSRLSKLEEEKDNLQNLLTEVQEGNN